MAAKAEFQRQEIRSLPVHIAIIMDGNGRWALAQKMARTAGHKEGLETAKRIVIAALDLGIKYLTLYIFSTENWKRTTDEVNFLMGLISQNLKKEYDFYRKNKIRVLHSGNMDQLPKSVRRDIQDAMRDTEQYDRLIVNLAINYGGRNEIVRAVNRWMETKNSAENRNQLLDEQQLREHLDCPKLPDPDLIIRTGGERRLSNFLLWESAYSEYYFSGKLWPDFSAEDLREAIDDYTHRVRKFGGVQ